MAYNVIIMPTVKRRVDMSVYYTIETLGNRQVAKAILADVKATKKKLSIVVDSLKLCDNPALAQYGYRKIGFEKHNFLVIYRIDAGEVIVDDKFREL